MNEIEQAVKRLGEAPSFIGEQPSYQYSTTGGIEKTCVVSPSDIQKVLLDRNLLKARIAELEVAVGRLEDALHRIVNRCEAYPIDVFHEPTSDQWAKANSVLASNGISMSAMNASSMRHVVENLKEIVQSATAAAGGKG